MRLDFSSATTNTAVWWLLLLSSTCVPANGQEVNVQSVNNNQANDDFSPYHTQQILLDFFQGTNGFGWTANTNWNAPNVDVCDWNGITCYPDNWQDARMKGHIQDIRLPSNNLVGTVPANIFEIPYLEHFDVSDNRDLDVDLSGLSQAQFLKKLDIGKTAVSNIDSIGDASNLDVLVITGLGLTGTPPNSLFTLRNLAALFANDNNFSGPLPAAIGQLTNLDELYLYGNDFTGQIPSHIGLLTTLQILTLSQNSFGGTLPTELEAMTDLQTIAISREGDNLKGPGIAGSIPAFKDHASLTQLSLENQMFNGQLDPDFLFSAPNGERVTVDLSNNQLSGNVPGSLATKAQMNLYLADNQFTGVSSDIYNAAANTCPSIGQWMDSTVQTLGCDAFLCPPSTWAPEGRTTADASCSSCGDDSTIWGRTECASSTTSDASERQALVNFYNSMGGKEWKSDTNWLSLGTTSVCNSNWFGVDCNAQGQVISINLRDNGLSGIFPQELFSDLPQLQFLNLNGNNIKFSFSGIGAASNLETLDLTSVGLTDEDVTNLADIASLSNLKVLSLASNNLGGAIPTPLYGLTSLEELNLSFNRFTGPISASIGQMVNLKVLSLGGNMLTGQLPTQLGALSSLLSLSAGENQFGGTLPMELNSLTNLQSLALQQVIADGGISGPLLSFNNLAQLTSLALDSNKLSGNLPTDFLANSLVLGQRIELGLSDNEFTGGLPGGWSRFDNLFVDVAGNSITSIDASLCSKTTWMDGDVQNYQCDAILCPSGTYNQIGRESDAITVCTSCSGGTGGLLGSKTCGGQAPAPEDENSPVAILEQFFVATGGIEWGDNTNWAGSTDYCSFYGVTCEGGHVTKIDMTGNNLKGTPPSSIFKLPNLRELILSNNDLDFKFDGIVEAASLITLHLDNTNLASLVGVGAAPNLVSLKAANNALQGQITNDVFLIPGLRELDLGYNMFSGRIPNLIGALTSLEELHLYHCGFSDRLPAALGDLTNLRVLNLAENNFDGTIPAELNELTSLRFLSLQREGGILGTNDIGIDQGSSSALGPGLSGALPAFDKLPFLTELYLGVNSLSGLVPFNFLDGIVDTTLEIKVDLTSNRIEGTVPASLAQFDKLSLYLADNRITEIANGLCSKSQWLSGDVGTYSCDGILCPAGTYNSIGREGAGAPTCTPCNSGTSSFMGSFNCLTTDEHATNSERAVLEKIYNEMRGNQWINSHNWMDPDVSICDWYGVGCVSADQESIRIIDLENNGLQLQLPTEVYSLPNLKELVLSGNVIVVPFDGISGAQNLDYLDVEGCALTTLSGVEQAPNLKALLAGSNAFGAFPPEVFQLPNLEILSLSDNIFPSQAMPDSFQSLPNLIYLECSNCGFTGNIPTWIGSFTKMEFLRLDQNGFVGPLPTELQQLGNLKHIDLSDQHLDGHGLQGGLLPFATQSQLTEVYLQHNNFEGPIPAAFLQSVPNTLPVTMDLRYNRLNETVPVELARIDNLNIYVAANNFNNPIPDALCSKSGWNDGNTIEHGCQAISCDKGTFNAYGRAIGDLECLPCEEDHASYYLGSTFCGSILEHSALLALYRTFNGPNWKSDQNWLHDEDHCTWEGITCHEEGEFQGLVKEINLEDNGLAGAVNALFADFFWNQVWSLEGLQYLNLQKNEIAISFRGSANAINLDTVMLDQTLTASLEGIGAATSLTSLHLTNSKLEGQMPDEFFALTNLEDVYMSHNQLIGTLSTMIGNLRSLQNLYVFGNRLTGNLPTELGLLNRIEHLSLGENRFTGEIPIHISSLPLLTVLSLQSEEVDPTLDDTGFAGGGGLSGPLPALDGLPRINQLFLGHNSFTGPIPDHFLQGVTDKSQKIIVDLTYNDITGSIPPSLAAFDDLQILLAANMITGIPDEICQKLNWFEGAVGDSCDAILCKPGTFNANGRMVTTENPCEPCTYPQAANDVYGSTHCGPVDISSYDDKGILNELYDAAGGQGWSNKDGWEDDGVSFCSWFGITCGTDSTGSPAVTEISLPGNGLNGIIPSIIYHLPELRKLDVRRNDVTMTFGASGEATSLEELYLDETRVSRLEGIGQAAALQALHIRKANFNGGTIPDDVFALPKLTDLDLSESGFGGKLSPRVGDMTSLERLSVVGNDLTGPIPSQIGLIPSIKILELSGNRFYGPIPSQFSNLVALESVFLDNTQGTSAGLSGSLHPFSTMPELREVHLSNNQLTGEIPGDFLAGITDLDATINVHLDSNHLVGTVPSELSRFSRLNIELADNLFVALGDGLCTKSDWLNGAVGQYNCNGLLCPAGTFSSNGRQTSNADPCQQCPGDENSPYMGVSVCISLQKQREREILMQLYQATGGQDWTNNDGWMDDTVDICEWYGINCQQGSTVEEILLGRNHLVGTVPTEIYQLPNLKFLWLYSNPVDISFDGISQASNLQNLLLDSTKLRSLNGIGRAVSLTDLDIRFNQLSGLIPEEIGSLINLESFTCSENEFSGPIPDLSSLTRLNTLRMSSNKLTGSVPSFAANSMLTALDLSENKLVGTIPFDMLESASVGQDIFVDLSENMITGTVPGELKRFADLTLYLRDNQIEGINPALCSEVAWNGGDVGSFNCDGILCPSGTHSPTGRASRSSEGATCESCGKNKYFGSTTCGSDSSTGSRASSPALITISLTIFSIIGLLAW